MPAYRFSWDPFDDRTVLELARDIGYENESDGARAFLVDQVSRPNDDFIRRTKDTLTRVWLPQHDGIAKAIVSDLFEMNLGPGGKMPKTPKGCLEYITRCRNSLRLREFLFARLISFGDVARDKDAVVDEDFIPSFGVLVPSKQKSDQRRPFAHQKEAWTKLDAHLSEAKMQGVFKGVLVMPTGSGKTFTAANWLTRRWVDAGNRVLWLAHREELLTQAARAVSQCASLATKRDRLRLRLVSSRNCRFHQIDPADDIVCCSVQSLARAGDEARHLLLDERLFVVIDEAHHAPAKSYRDAIEILATAGSYHLLGLTATPTRTAEHERPALSRLFGERIIYQVSMGELISRELLARPIPSSVKTKVDAEVGMSVEDRRHLVTFHEPSAEMLARLGQDERRNQLIVRHYEEHAAKFGKTLVFTTDVIAAALLKQTFRDAGIQAEYLASYRPDTKKGEHVDRTEVLRTYSDPRSGLDVLINVDMLTEGVDLPSTRTVFLARPTSSDILFRQMIGRALRGPQSGGNLEAHIVSFEDHWSTYSDFLSPLDWIAETDAVPVEPPVTPPVAEFVDESSTLSWDQIIAITHAIRAQIGDSAADIFEAVPHGMYVLDYTAEGEGVRRVIHVYDHQRPCWNALFDHLQKLARQAVAAVDTDALYADLFGDCDPPKPALLDIDIVVERFQAGDPLPLYTELSGRSACDPRTLAKHAREKDLRRSEENALLEERHSPLARIIYPTMLEFRRAFDDAMRELEHPGEGPPPKGVPMFEPLPSNPLRPGPHYDIKKLTAEMLRRGSELVGHTLVHQGSVEWTRRPIKGWYGMAWFGNQPGSGEIKINVLLDSPELSESALLYLLWHEYMHLYLMTGHTAEFRKLEHLWPDHAACDREMDNLNEKFGVQYW